MSSRVILGCCRCPGLLSLSWGIVAVLGCCHCPGPLSPSWVVVAVLGCCHCPGLLSPCWVVVVVLGTCGRCGGSDGQSPSLVEGGGGQPPLSSLVVGLGVAVDVAPPDGHGLS